MEHDVQHEFVVAGDSLPLRIKIFEIAIKARKTSVPS